MWVSGHVAKLDHPYRRSRPDTSPAMKPLPTVFGLQLEVADLIKIPANFYRPGIFHPSSLGGLPRTIIKPLLPFPSETLVFINVD